MQPSDTKNSAKVNEAEKASSELSAAQRILELTRQQMQLSSTNSKWAVEQIFFDPCQNLKWLAVVWQGKIENGRLALSDDTLRLSTKNPLLIPKILKLSSPIHNNYIESFKDYSGLASTPLAHAYLLSYLLVFADMLLYVHYHMNVIDCPKET